ncbi:hypothetical protein CHGG_04293 [Chaetomium globosum CBS 148.51]|uniref:NADP-dependent oxidoreductase domain-containing protein n=1 Tax=Chaetomium globosum (strain ATCC 6205 / CBS 148.51 / DSM 1962 / NBRC 6347 / NRRL 1970) TaxID=306901 RepID=Q2H1Q3_CHAGB|nr:uncharacterized protein CHGG_04293 [Chaetomium globosum CBS 148.51]EAQ87674.1 hypothetical protein CHGG_04293 [Chaetomium globosum CBS 148.51]
MAETKNTSKTFQLNTGKTIPAIGLGTWQSQPGEGDRRGASAASGRAARGDLPDQPSSTTPGTSGPLKRSSARSKTWAWITSTYTSCTGPSSTTPEDLKKHYPDWDFVDTWREMQKLMDTNKIRNLGVSNFGIKNLERLLNDPSCKIVPAVNQIELHPGNPSPKLIAYCAEKGIHCSGYSPLGSSDSPLYKNETIASIAKAKNRSVQQVLLMWGVKKGWSVLPKSVNPDRVKANFDLDGWDLTDEEVAKIDSIPDRFKVCGDAWLPIKVFFGDDE